MRLRAHFKLPVIMLQLTKSNGCEGCLTIAAHVHCRLAIGAVGYGCFILTCEAAHEFTISDAIQQFVCCLSPHVHNQGEHSWWSRCCTTASCHVLPEFSGKHCWQVCRAAIRFVNVLETISRWKLFCGGERLSSLSKLKVHASIQRLIYCHDSS